MAKKAAKKATKKAAPKKAAKKATKKATKKAAPKKAAPVKKAAPAKKVAPAKKAAPKAVVKKKMVVVNDHKEICILFLPLFFFVSNGLGMFSKWKFIQITPGCRTDESPSLLLCIFVVSFLGFETFLFFQQLTRNTLVRVKLKKRNFQKHTQSTKK